MSQVADDLPTALLEASKAVGRDDIICVIGRTTWPERPSSGWRTAARPRKPQPPRPDPIGLKSSGDSIKQGV